MPRKVPTGIEDSWTDDLPHCNQSGEGHSVNQVYRKTGHPLREHYDEDSYFRLRSEPDSGIALYGICDGHDGKEVADYAAQKLPAELLLGQVTTQSSVEEVKDAIKQAFQAVESGFLTKLDGIIAARDDLMQQFTADSAVDRNEPYGSLRQRPDYQRQISALNRQISAGSSAALSLLIEDQLYVANIGDVRVLVCKRDVHGSPRVFQLSTDHDVHNADEAFRLAQLGLYSGVLEHFNHVTRCLGDHTRKGGYRDFELISGADAEPVIAEPDIVGPIPVDPTWMFLFLCSAGLYNCYLEATSCSEESLNSNIAGLIGTAIDKETSLSAVAQSVVDQIARLHYEAFMNSSLTDETIKLQQMQKKPFSSSVSVPDLKGAGESPNRTQHFSGDQQDTNPPHQNTNNWNLAYCHKREDMTLIVRSFNNYGGVGPGVLSPPSLGAIYTNPTTYDYDSNTQDDNETSTWQDSMDSRANTLKEPPPPRLPVDDNGRIAPYVDFSQFFEAQARYRLDSEADQPEAANTTTVLKM